MKIKRYKKYLIFQKKMVNFSQTFVVYHGCGNGYLDGARKIVPKNRKCIAPTYYPFQKKPIDVHNRVETRAQLKAKTKVTRNRINRYMRYVDVFSRNSFTSDHFLDDSLTSDDESLAKNAPNTEQSLYSDDKTEKSTGVNLIIDENTDTKQTNLISDTQNPDNETNETNKKSLPFTMYL